MRDQHIIPLLDRDRFGNLSESDVLLIESHISQCVGCRDAHAAARAAAALLHARAAATIEPSPFFATRVMALVREEQRAPSLLDFVTIWKATRGLVLSLVSVAVLLVTLTFLTPAPNDRESVARLEPANYSTEGVLFGDEITNTDESASNALVIDDVFTPEDTDATDQK